MWLPGRPSQKKSGTTVPAPALEIPKPGSVDPQMQDLEDWSSQHPDPQEFVAVANSAKAKRSWFAIMTSRFTAWQERREAKRTAKAQAKVDAAPAPNAPTVEARNAWWDRRSKMKVVTARQEESVAVEEPAPMPSRFQRLSRWWETSSWFGRRPAWKVTRKSEQLPKPPMTPAMRVVLFGTPLVIVFLVFIVFIGKVLLSTKAAESVVESSQDDEQPVPSQVQALPKPKKKIISSPPRPISAESVVNSGPSDDEIRRILQATGSSASVEQFKQADAQRRAWQNSNIASSNIRPSSPWANFHPVAAPPAPPPSGK